MDAEPTPPVWRVGAAPKTRSCLSGGTGTGEPEPERGRRQSTGLSRRRAPQEPRSSAETDGWKERNGNSFDIVGSWRTGLKGEARMGLSERSRRKSRETVGRG